MQNNNPVYDLSKYGFTPVSEEELKQKSDDHSNVNDLSKYGFTLVENSQIAQPSSNIATPSPTPSAATGQEGQFQGEDSVGRFAARTAKSGVSGAVGGTVDTATSLWNLPVAAFNLLKEKLKGEDPRVLASMGLGDFIGLEDRESPDIPMIPSATHGIEKGLDSLTEGYTATPQNEKPLQAGIRSAAGFAAGGGLGIAAGKAGLSGIQKASNFLGSTNPRAIGGAAAVGGVSEDARQKGDSELGAVGKGALAGIAVEAASSPSLLAAAARSIPKTILKLSGAGKKSINTEAIDAANRIGVDLPLVAVSSSQAANSRHQLLSRTPIAQEFINNKSLVSSSQYKDSFDNFLNKIGPKVENKEEFSEITRELYKRSKELAPKDAVIPTAPLLTEIENIKNSLKSLGANSPETDIVLSFIEKIEKRIVNKNEDIPEFLKNAPPNIKKQLEKISDVKDVTLKEILREKVEVNKLMSNKKIFTRSDSDSLDRLRSVAKALDDRIEEVGKSYPEFYQAFRDAQKEYGRYAKREQLENVLRDRLSPPSSPDVPNYNALVTFMGKKKQKEFFRNTLGEYYNDLKDYIDVAKAIESINKKDKNKSGSGWVGAVTKMIDSLTKSEKSKGLAFGTSLLGVGYAAATNPIPTAAVASLVGGLTALSTSKRFINLANRYAKNPTPDLSKKLETIIKDVTGASARELGMEIYNALDKEE